MEVAVDRTFGVKATVLGGFPTCGDGWFRGVSVGDSPRLLNLAGCPGEFDSNPRFACRHGAMGRIVRADWGSRAQQPVGATLRSACGSEFRTERVRTKIDVWASSTAHYCNPLKASSLPCLTGFVCL